MSPLANAKAAMTCLVCMSSSGAYSAFTAASVSRASGRTLARKVRTPAPGFKLGGEFGIDRSLHCSRRCRIPENIQQLLVAEVQRTAPRVCEPAFLSELRSHGL